MLSTAMQTFVQAVLIATGLMILVYAVSSALSRQYARALLGVVCGLVFLATIYFFVFPSLGDTESQRLRDQLAAVQAEDARTRADLVKARRDHAQMEADNFALSQRLDQAARTHASHLDDILSEIDRTRTTLTRRETGLELEPGYYSLPRTNDRHEQAIARARELSALRPRPLQPTPPPSPQVEQRQDQLRNLMDLKERMAARMSTPSYDVEVYPDRELVGGRKGRYYVVDLKNAESGVRFFFEGGRYTLSRADGEFRRSLNAFIGDVLGKLDGNVRYDMFVRGSADRTPYEGRFEDGHQYRQIRYLRSAGGDKYLADQGERTLGSTVRNQDLPELRAMFLRKLVEDSYPVKPPIILEGVVSTKANSKDRNAELILFVDW